MYKQIQYSVPSYTTGIKPKYQNIKCKYEFKKLETITRQRKTVCIMCVLCVRGITGSIVHH